MVVVPPARVNPRNFYKMAVTAIRRKAPYSLVTAGSILEVLHLVRAKRIGSAAACLAALALAGCNGSAPAESGGGKFGKGKGFAGGGPVPVEVATVTSKSVPIEIQVVGNVEAYSVVSVRAQVSGQLTGVNIRDGQDVRKGDPLFAIDARPLEGQLLQANANLARSTAQLEQAEANLQRDMAQERNARAVAERAQKLFEEKLISREQADQLRTTADVQANALNADRAAINSARAQIEADRAAIQNLRLQLSYTQVEAPIDGRAGNVTNKLGNIVTANNTELVQILQVEPIYVTFAVPEARLAEVKRYMGSGTLPVTARPQDGSGDAEHGQLTFVDNAVDSSTGTIKLKGTFQNKGHKLWPGQFANVTLRLTTRGGALVVPNQAVQTGQDGTFVYVVKADRTVEVRPVTTGPRVDLDLVIENGLQAGETVVTVGQLRLQPGSRVQVRGEGGGREGRPGAQESKGGSSGDFRGGREGRFQGGFKSGTSDGGERGRSSE
jgi:multidrug efflux system membrane fusion protein